MNINNRLVNFAQQNLVLSHNELERNKINVSINYLERVLRNFHGNNIKEFIRFGSFTRNTGTVTILRDHP